MPTNPNNACEKGYLTFVLSQRGVMHMKKKASFQVSRLQSDFNPEILCGTRKVKIKQVRGKTRREWGRSRSRFAFLFSCCMLGKERDCLKSICQECRSLAIHSIHAGKFYTFLNA